MEKARAKMILDLTKTDGSIQRIDAPDNAEGDYSHLNLSRAWIRDRKLTNIISSALTYPVQRLKIVNSIGHNLTMRFWQMRRLSIAISQERSSMELS